MKKLLLPFVWGALFGVGLVLSGMTQPEKVRGFLDFAGAWDPSLAFVMGAALLVVFVLRPLVVKRRGSIFPRLTAPRKVGIDAKLLGGAAIFGVGWGLAGYCPGPALVATGGGSLEALLTVVAMIVGIKLVDLVRGRNALAADRQSSVVDGCS